MPEEYGNYLITAGGDVDIGTFRPDLRNGWSCCDADGFYWTSEVIAWMPLPEAYKESEDYMNITTGEVLIGLIATTVIAIGIVVKVLKNGIR